MLDPRRHAFRFDLASHDLKGKVNAPRYALGTDAQVRRSSVPVRSNPDTSAPLCTELLFGELVTIYDDVNGWAWIQSRRDRYVGYVPVATLTKGIIEPTHRIRALGSFVYPLPNIKTSPLMHLSLNARVTAGSWTEGFRELATGGFISERDVSSLGSYESDFVSVAERFVGTPYLWGGAYENWARLLWVSAAYF